MSLQVYNRKRKFAETPEPRGKKNKKSGNTPLRFVVQLHEASRLHFDLRLEFGGVFRSWAVPKGPSLNPLDQRLAVFVEDHPLEYGSFEGIIPKGNYGAGTVMIWDEGTYLERSSSDRKQSEAAMAAGFEKGHLTFVLEGHVLQGEFALIKLKKDENGKAWLLVKKRDSFSTYKRAANAKEARSVVSGRTMAMIAQESKSDGAVWDIRKEGTPTLKKKPPAPPPKMKVKTPRQPPMPRKIKPMVAVHAREELGKGKWIFEPQLGGLRAIAEVEGKRAHLYSKSGLSFDKKFPEIADELRAQKFQMVLDGEIIKGKTPVYHVFDILYYQGEDLRERPLSERKKILVDAVTESAHLKLVSGSAKSLGQAAVAKDADSLYKSGVNASWVLVSGKVKTEKAASSNEPLLTHLDKIYWPKEKITKGDLVSYYRDMAPYILPHLKDRPQSLNRYPNGIEATGFFQKDMTGHLPRWLKTHRISSASSQKSINYLLCQDVPSLLYMANLGCIEINPWFSRVGNLERPDFLVVDLDPDGNDFKHIVEIAHAVREVFSSVGAPSYCKTSGATGLHIGVPLGGKYDFDEARNFTHEVCKIVAQQFPQTTSLDRNPNRRRKKVYLDFMQNRRGQTLASAFCVRPRAGAPVSMPVRWEDLSPRIRPEQFTIKNALSRVEKLGDSWKPVLGPGIHLQRCLKQLQTKYGTDI